MPTWPPIWGCATVCGERPRASTGTRSPISISTARLWPGIFDKPGCYTSRCRVVSRGVCFAVCRPARGDCRPSWPRGKTACGRPSNRDRPGDHRGDRQGEAFAAARTVAGRRGSRSTVAVSRVRSPCGSALPRVSSRVPPAASIGATGFARDLRAGRTAWARASAGRSCEVLGSPSPAGSDGSRIGKRRGAAQRRNSRRRSPRGERTRGVNRPTTPTW